MPDLIESDSTASARPTSRTHRARALVLTGALVATTAAIGIAAPAASAAGTTDVYLGGLGLFTAACPVTPTNTVYVQPGTTLRFHADATGLGASGGPLVSLQTTMTNPLNNQQSFTVGSDASSYRDIGFGGAGTFGFTWNAQLGSVTVTVPGGSGSSGGGGGAVGGLLGGVGSAVGGVVGGVTGSVTKTIQVPLVASVTGAKLGWAGQIVVSNRAQTCSLAPQLPSVNVSPSLPVIGQLPGISVPGLQLPGVTVPGTGSTGAATGSGTGTAGSTPGTTSTTTSTVTNPFGYVAPDCTGPCAVVPRGSGSGGSVGEAYDVTLTDLGVGSTAATGDTGNGGSGANAGGGGANQLAARGGGDAQAANAAALFDNATGAPAAVSTSWPTALGIAAGVVFAVVALGAGLPWARRRLHGRS